MRRILILVVTALVATLTISAVASAQATTTTESFTVPYEGVLQNPCGGEDVAFSGDLHIVLHNSSDASGGFNLLSHVNTQDITATGVQSGEPYRFKQVSSTVGGINDAEAQRITGTFVLQITSTGPPPNPPDFLVHSVFHITVTPDGERVAEVENFKIECKG